MIAFTICSNNYLDKAAVLLNSIKIQSDITVYLFLADQKSEYINYDELGFDKILTPEQLDIINLQWQLENYNIIEFNTAIKGAAFNYLFKFTQAKTLYYLDPDIKVYQPLNNFDEFWKNYSILLTPHILKPIPMDGLFPEENLFLNHGIYNLGFLGLRRSEVTVKFLNWWSERLTKKCIIDLKNGYFTDQIWFNLVPLLFESVYILNHPGFNAAYWNLHERTIELKDGKFKVNEREDLFFYHFSCFDMNLEYLTPKANPRYTFQNRPEMRALYSDYLKDIIHYTNTNYKSVKYYNSLYPIRQKTTPIGIRILKRILKELKGKNANL